MATGIRQEQRYPYRWNSIEFSDPGLRLIVSSPRRTMYLATTTLEHLGAPIRVGFSSLTLPATQNPDLHVDLSSDMEQEPDAEFNPEVEYVPHVEFDLECLCVRQANETFCICWLPDSFKVVHPISQKMVQDGSWIVIGGEDGEILYVDFKGLQLPSWRSPITYSENIDGTLRS